MLHHSKMIEFLTLYVLFAMLATCWLDVTRYTIPNWLVGSLLLLYPVAFYLHPNGADWKMALAAMGLVFACGFVVFSLRIMGGGDIKLITVLALWVGWTYLADFVVLFALLGGVFSIFLLVMRKLFPYLPLPKTVKTPRIFQAKAPIPYGVAIAGAFVMLMSQGKINVLLATLQ
jgi:prepilin peptidase CpaA